MCLVFAPEGGKLCQFQLRVKKGWAMQPLLPSELWGLF